MDGQNDLMGGLTAAMSPVTGFAGTMAPPMFGDYDDYTGRMGADGEPERYSAMLGGDPRVRQQALLEDYQRRLQSPITIGSWLTSADRDVRGLDPASQITLTPGAQYRIRDYTGDRSGEIIASGSTPEELLRLQDVAQGLARQGRMADYRIEQVGGEPVGGLGQYQDPTTGEVVTLLGGDLYNRPWTATAADVLKVAAPIALQFVPGLGTALGAKLGLSGALGKAAGVGLTSALGRAGAGIATGENVGQALKSGAIGGLASGATAGLLNLSGADKVIADALGGTKATVVSTAAQSKAERAAEAAGEEIMTVVGRKVLPSLLTGGISAGIGSVAPSLADLLPTSQFDQAMELARMQNQYGVPMPGDSPMITVGSGAGGAGVSPGAVLGAAAGATGYEILPDGSIQFNQTPEQIDVTSTPTQKPSIEASIPAAVAGSLPTTTAPPTVEPGEITVTAKPVPDTDIDAALAAVGAGPLSDLAQSTLETEATASQKAENAPEEQAKAEEKKGGLGGVLGKVSAGLTALELISALFGGGRGGGSGAGLGPGAADLGTRASLDPVFGAQLPAPRAGSIFSPSSLAPRDMSGIDFARYGYGPAQSFFENVPRNPEEYRSALSAATAPRPVTPGAGSVPVPPIFQQPFDPNLNTGIAPADAIRRLVPDATDEQITEYLATPEGAQFLQTLRDAGLVTAARGGMMAAKGGAPKSRDAYAVKGPGTGRSDEIPALLSDGEYVIDAETVAMLGDGSSEAGAKRLDDFRVSIRKHKGRNLAKGKFSANAKRPENYLSGGRV
jgi:hypothetical protein